jgi:hypothetical protein
MHLGGSVSKNSSLGIMGKLRVLPDSVVDRDTVGMDEYHHHFIPQQKP